MSICNGCEFVPELYYDREFQIWVARDYDGTFRVGMTDISQSIAGAIMHVRVRRPGTDRPAGRPVATVESSKWAGPIPNLMDCVIVEGNVSVLENPSLLNADPYGAWIARVRPVGSIENALAPLVTGANAEAAYCERVVRDKISCRRREVKA